MNELLKLLPLNIQLFGEDSPANEPEETGDVDGDNIDDDMMFSDGTSEPEEQDTSNNEDAHTKTATKKYSERLNSDRAKIREDIEKEYTGKLDKIAKARGFENWAELEEYSAQQQLEELGVQDKDAFKNYVNNIIDNNSEVLRARQIIAEQQEREAKRQLEEQVAEIGKLDSTITNVNDLLSHPSYDRIVERVKKGANIVDAYKLENFDALTGRNTEAAKQSVYNNINNKSHVNTVRGTSPNDVIVPNDIMAIYRKNFPHWTDEQIKKHYAKEGSN
jgi:hypothetical protein